MQNFRGFSILSKNHWSKFVDILQAYFPDTGQNVQLSFCRWTNGKNVDKLILYTVNCILLLCGASPRL
jgi:hypothetical protein